MVYDNFEENWQFRDFFWARESISPDIFQSAYFVLFSFIKNLFSFVAFQSDQ